ncbi:hypothetical protein MMC07_000073 [Pseudocyphellaria aurata]|nr:hypothetical protein [Pseudocyphellaria aurata]
MVAEHLTDDKDLWSFMLTCHGTHAIIACSGGFWRTRFNSVFDPSPGKTVDELKTLYQYRRKKLGKPVDFQAGHEADEVNCLRIIRDLAIESCNYWGMGRSKNIDRLREFVTKSNLLHKLFCGRPVQLRMTGLFQAIQLLLTHWSLDLSMKCPTYSFEISQKVVYTHPDVTPIFKHRVSTVNMTYLLHIVNFFKYHITVPEEKTLHPFFKELAEDQRPRAWDNGIDQGLSRVGTTWKGTYAYMDSRLVRQIRNVRAGSAIFMDGFGIEWGDGAFQSLHLDFDPAHCCPWPRGFEEHLQALPSHLSAAAVHGHAVEPRRRGRDYLLFSGTGMDNIPFHCSGVLHALPPQHDIPGWQRISIMKKFDPEPRPPADPSAYAPSSSTTADTSTPNPFTPDWDQTGRDGEAGGHIDMSTDDYWCYEGVVLPGGKIILGRWFSPNEDRAQCLNTGPFIFWNVPAY